MDALVRREIDKPVSMHSLTQMLFRSAAEAYLEKRRPYIAEKTHHEYRLNINTLDRFFGQFRLQEIDGDMVRTFQSARKAEGVGASGINHECGLLCQMRNHICIPLTDYQPLRLPKEKPGRVLSDSERTRLLRFASSNVNWESAYFFALISVNTGAGPKEIASLRLKDFEEREVLVLDENGNQKTIKTAVLNIIEGTKNDEFRPRSIPLNDEALKGIKLAITRAKRLGSHDPDHHIFPFRIRPSNNRRSYYDPERHQTSFKAGWKALTKTALLGNLKMYDLRRHVTTVMLENPEISDETIENIIGHAPNSRTKKRYSYIRQRAMRKAVEALGPQKPIKPERQTKSRVKWNFENMDQQQIVAQFAQLSAAMARLFQLKSVVEPQITELEVGGDTK